MTILTPPDLAQCQVTEYSPFAMGGSTTRRCPNQPLYVVHETMPAEDGLMGSMSVCYGCRARHEMRKDGTYINPTWRWEAIA